MDHKTIGLLRLVDLPTKQDIEREISLSFADLYALIDDVQTETRNLEEDLNKVFYGQDGNGEPRFTRPFLRSKRGEPFSS
jgi:hypothetical protein